MNSQVGQLAAWKRIILWGFSIGFGLVIGAAILIGGYLWYEGRPKPSKPWNKTAIRASFDFLDTEGDQNTLCLYYTLDNGSSTDYRLNAADVETFAAKLEREGSLSAPSEGENFLRIDLPIFVPAKHKLRAIIHLAYPCDIHQKAYLDGKGNPDRKAFRAKLATWVNAEFSNLYGFVLFDKQNRYEIEFPKGW